MMGQSIMTPDATPDERGWVRGEVWEDGEGSLGDYAVGKSYDTRFWHKLVDDTYALVTVVYYVEDLNALHNVEDGDDGYELNNYALQERTEFMHCSDLDDSGGSEITSDYEYQDIDGYLILGGTLEQYEEVCRKLALRDYRKDLYFMEKYPEQPGFVLAQLMKPGDKFLREQYGQPDVVVEVLREREPCKDIFGRDMFQFWCRREDTGQEGYVTFGFGGVVKPVEKVPA